MDLTVLVIARLEQKRREAVPVRCPTASAFYAGRRLVRGAGLLGGVRVAPSTRLAEVPRGQRRYVIECIEAGVRLHGAMPRTRLSLSARARWWFVVGHVVFWLMAGGCVWAEVAAGWLAVMVGAAGSGLLVWWAARVASVPPKSVDTIGALIRRGWFPAIARAVEPVAHGRAVYERVRRLLAEQMAVPIERIGPGTRFVEDLKMG